MYDIMLKLEARKAIPSPPLSTILGPSGINIYNWGENYRNIINDKGNSKILKKQEKNFILLF